MKTVIVDYRISELEKENLNKLSYKTLLCPKSPLLYEAICGHPDIQLNIIDENTIMVHKNIQIDFVTKLKSLNKNIIYSHSNLSSKYPEDILLNAVNLKNFFIHKIKNTDKNLLNIVKHKKLINVNQGYTKCSTAVINNTAVITSDKSIANALYNENFDVLLLPPGDILLPGLNYGFIGGTCGLLEEGLLTFYGDLNYYTYGNEVISFLKKHKVEPVFLRKGKLIDRGSILRV